jgi:hypothetical protein
MEIFSDDRPDSPFRRHRVEGKLDFDALVAELRDIYGDPSFRPDQDSLWDLRGARLATVSTPEVRRIVDLVLKHWGTEGAPRSALVVSTEADFGMARMYEMLIAAELGPSVGVFRDVEEAEAWLEGGGDAAGG